MDRTSAPHPPGGGLTLRSANTPAEGARRRIKGDCAMTKLWSWRSWLCDALGLGRGFEVVVERRSNCRGTVRGHHPTASVLDLNMPGG